MSNADIGLLCSLMINDRFLPEPRNMAAISRVKDDESVKRDTSGQIVKGEQRRATEKHSGKIVASDDQKVSDDEEYTVKNILAKSGHHDGSIYRGMDTWWKRNYLIADHNESKRSISLFYPTAVQLHILL